MSGFGATQTQYPSRNFITAVPSDSVLLDGLTRGIFCTAPGNLVAQNLAGVSSTFALAAGQIVAINPSKIMATGTTGTYIILR